MVTLKSSLSRWRTHRLIETYTEMESDSHLPHPRTWELLGVLAIFGPLPLLTYTPLYTLKDASEDLQSPFLTETSISSKSRLPLPSPPGEAAHSSTFRAAPSQETGSSQMLTSTSRPVLTDLHIETLFSCRSYRPVTSCSFPPGHWCYLFPCEFPSFTDDFEMAARQTQS